MTATTIRTLACQPRTVASVCEFGVGSKFIAARMTGARETVGTGRYREVGLHYPKRRATIVPESRGRTKPCVNGTCRVGVPMERLTRVAERHDGEVFCHPHRVMRITQNRASRYTSN